MPKLLCKTVDSFAIEGLGTIVLLEDSKEWRIPADEVVRIRESIRMLRPDGSSIKTFIKGLEFALVRGSDQMAIELPKGVGVQDVPAGSLVFLEREDADPILWDGVRASFESASENLELGWRRTRHRLDLARQAIVHETRSMEPPLCFSHFEEHLGHNELECALGILESLCESFVPPPLIWELLASAAESMGLDERAGSLRECAVAIS
ncbi:MAG: hypothetical protein EOP83_04560 [Verrucomicrobiaceae bacterium]|nr:MAG: hypothetical protein EOP83_04560 [Verrucomicrobiaceae bacterium]